MPYDVKKVDGGYKAVTSAGPHAGHEHSSKPLSKERAEAQQRALYANAGEDAHHKAKYQSKIDRAHS